MTLLWSCNYFFPSLWSFKYFSSVFPTGGPVIDLPLEYTEVVKYRAGTSVKLRAGISGKPEPTIEWYKDDKELQTNALVCVENTTDLASILIKDASRLNSGSYELKLRNAMGSASATIRVQILGRCWA